MTTPQVKAKDWSEARLTVHIRERFPAPAYACLLQVRNGTGYTGRTRTADAVAMGLWPSRGIDVHGMEIKVSRSDWKAELKNPIKAHAIQQYCDHWWVVAPSTDVVPIAELPPNWGLLVPHGKSLRAAKEAPKLEAVPLDRLFVASVLRNVQQHTHGQRSAVEYAAMGDELGALRESLNESHRKQLEEQRQRAEQAYQALQKTITDFEAASGVHINTWQGGLIGEAVRFVVDGHMPAARRAVARMADELQTRSASLRETWERLEAEAKELGQ